MRKDNLDMTFTGHTEGKSVRRKQRVTFLVITGKMGGRTGSGRDSEQTIISPSNTGGKVSRVMFLPVRRGQEEFAEARDSLTLFNFIVQQKIFKNFADALLTHNENHRLDKKSPIFALRQNAVCEELFQCNNGIIT